MKFRLRKKFNKFIIWMLIGVVVLVGVNTIIPAPRHTPKTTKKIQGIWLTHVGNNFLSYTGQTDNVFHQLSGLNFNRIYVDVYNGGTTYPSNYSLKNNWITLPFTDPLKAAIKEGERQGLKIYAWYEHGMMLHLNSKFAKQHPNWLLKTSTGEKAIDQHLWLNPKHPDVQQYFINLFTEVAKNYPNLYGIQLDDHWGIPTQFGNHARVMTELTRKIYQAVKTINPNLIISLSPNSPSFSYRKYSQNWLYWVRQGFIDEVIVQIYRKTSQEVINTLKSSGLREASYYVPVAVGIYSGEFYRPKPINELNKQIKIAENYGYGYSLFCWESTYSPFRNIKPEHKEAFVKTYLGTKKLFFNLGRFLKLLV
ncbi:MAG: family 10 glycosylhydrolase [Moorea sp. SIOASIH]|nr:family 10 glycosylhydrolase [Moorena sp. SIOASIH]